MSKPILKHLAIIMDGNRRWARERGLPSVLGHKKGYEISLKVGDWCLERNIKILTLWAFSTENWQRSQGEIKYLFNLTKFALKKNLATFQKKGVKIQFLGRLNELPKDLQKACQETMELTKDNKKATLNIALNYGGQAEIIDAVNCLIKDKITKVTHQIFQKYLYDPEMPAPDLIIRTAGEMRTSGFLLYQSAYSELYFTKTYWPDFSEKELDLALADYQKRQRRFGGN